MKRIWMIPMLALALVCAGCSSEEETPAPNGSGKLQLTSNISSAVSEVVARAAQSDLPEALVPDADALTLTIAGSYTDKGKGAVNFNKTWATVADFKTENPDFEAGYYNTAESHYQNSYKATLSYGDPAVEGEGKAAFAGASDDFVVYAGSQPTKVNVSVALANSCFTFAVTEWMLNYYDNLKLTIHTADSDFSFEPTTTDPSALIFVKKGAVLSFSGSAVKAQTGVEVTFPKTELKDANGAAVTTAAKTKYTISVDHGQAGAGTLSISFDDSFTEVPEQTVELNPDEN